ncbi:MAG: metallophosphoesterase [Chitinophagaceae bacterium]
MNKTQYARAYRDKYGMEMPTTKLARIMYKNEPLTFKDVEDARWVLRSIEGKAGKVSRTTKTHVLKERPKNPYKLPESDETQYEPFRINAKRLLVLSDIHIPYHSVTALTACIDYAKKYKPDAILLNGDTLDFHGLSRFARDPKKRSFAGELKAFEEFMLIIEKTFDCPIYFKIGNHEERYEHFLWQKAGELEGVEEFSLNEIIKKRANVEVIGDKRIIKAGDLNIIHGHEFGGSIFSPVNIARGLFLRAKVSAMQGHNHQTSEHTESNMNGQITTTWSLGCLCELHPAYLPINKWNHGFSTVDIDGENFLVNNLRIHKGKVL